MCQGRRGCWCELAGGIPLHHGGGDLSHRSNFNNRLQMPRNTYVGSWNEPISANISLPFDAESAMKVLGWGCYPESSPFSHQDIAHWCERFWNEFSDVDAPPEIERLLPVLADVETQWDLHLANSFSLKELQSLSFQNVRLPSKWFLEWLNQARA